jgi:hypothetical protein
MSTHICNTCGSTVHIAWEEAFDKFGFGDGDGLVMTDHVAEALRAHGYEVTAEPWGFHNIVIMSIKRGKCQLIPAKANVGYDDPRTYLPKKLVKLLDAAFRGDGKVRP